MGFEVVEVPDLPAPGQFTHVAKKGKFVFISGQTAVPEAEAGNLDPMVAAIAPSASSSLNDLPVSLTSIRAGLRSGRALGSPWAPTFSMAPCTQVMVSRSMP